jgi:uncharacterized protein YrrD
MLRNISDFINFKLGATDGEIGRVKDFYFDDHNWTVRYIIAETGTWLPGRMVLLSPFSLKTIDESQKVLHFGLTKQQIEDAPPIECDQPVTRQHEQEYAEYYGWPMYWYGPVLWGPVPHPVYEKNSLSAEPSRELPPEQVGDPHLRSVDEITGYHIQARDGEIGHIDDFVVDTEDWVLRYLVIDTRNWWPGKHVLIAPPWIQRISWEDAKVHVDLEQETLRHAPEYNRHMPINRPYETELFEYYGRKAYWLKEQRAAA